MNFNKILVLFISCALITIFLPINGFCELEAMNDDEMTEIYATGFADFTITDLGGDLTETRAWFNIEAFTYTEIDSLKLGYHDEYDYKNPTPTYGWDEDWENIVIGTDYEDPSTDFHASGFYFEADFLYIDDPANRELKSFRFGFDSVEGDISANFINFSGTINDGVGAPEYNGHSLNLGPATITSDGSNFEISLNIDDYDKGYWVTFDNAVVTPIP